MFTSQWCERRQRWSEPQLGGTPLLQTPTLGGEELLDEELLRDKEKRRSLSLMKEFGLEGYLAYL